MTDLAPMTALGGSTPLIDTIGAVTIAEHPDLSIASVAQRVGQVVADMPEVGLYAKGTLWVGPGQWLVTAPYEIRFVESVKARLGAAASVTDQTDAWAAFDITGPAEPVFERLCNIDIRTMQAGQATRTVIEHLGAFVIRTAEGFCVLGARSSAASLHHALVSAARSVA